MEDLLREFLAETSESLDVIDAELVRFEREPHNFKLLNHIFRLLHTIKGTCSFLGLSRLEAVSHAAEALMERFREGASVTHEKITLVLASVDRLKLIAAEIERHGIEQPGDDSDVIDKLAQAVQDSTGRPQDTSKKQESAHARHHNVRVGVDDLEHLIAKVSELAQARDRLLETSHDNEQLQRLSMLTSEVQAAAARMHMLPIGQTLRKLPRIMRDLARELGKNISFEMTGADMRLDLHAIELIKAPLLHIVRNCADHGIETPQERTAAGKPVTGKIRLSAAYRSGQAVIEITDDGRGIDIARIKQKAFERGLVTEAELAAMPVQKIQKLVFMPGFSTASKVTSVSGRGVGMDVVRANIEQARGSIELKSTPGVGTSVTIRLPLGAQAVTPHRTCVKKIVFVDDNAFFRNMLTPVLQSAGYEVHAFCSASDALRALGADNVPDAVVSDVEMPGMDGYEFAKKLKADIRFAAVPFIALSSGAERAATGIESHVAKFDREGLLAALQQTAIRKLTA